ncbi:hypothetical protein [Nitrosococcus wardiae]|uniref:Uncharacterized protein n=1 Tax=Nitrosococcus wardiae TaxID=1814290 RepID=A0A4P7C2F2_9GAMM|nr:hypothetical protein [Nitrosococcus wardiae]QBQ55840.1 hypothetical protein E3U44_15960 [Nitrosococcus wardiae]
MAEINGKKTTEEQIVSKLSSKGEFSEPVLGESEPWAEWETQLCLWSIGVGIVALVILGFLINQFLLS